MAIASFMEREVTELGVTVIGELDHNGSWSVDNVDVTGGLRLEADEDEDFEDDELEDDELEDDDFDDDFDDEDDFEDEDEFDDDDDFEDDEDVEETDDEDY